MKPSLFVVLVLCICSIYGGDVQMIASKSLEEEEEKKYESVKIAFPRKFEFEGRRALRREENEYKVAFHAFGKHYELELKRDVEVFASDFEQFKINNEGQLELIQGDRDCIFVGHVKNSLSSSNAIVSFCDGHITGHVQGHDETLVLSSVTAQKTENDNDNNVRVHRERDLLSAEASGVQEGVAADCGVSIEKHERYLVEALPNDGDIDDEINENDNDAGTTMNPTVFDSNHEYEGVIVRQNKTNHTLSTSATTTSITKYVKLVLVSDKKRFERFNKNPEVMMSNTKAIAAQIKYIYSSFIGDIRIQVQLVGIVSVENDVDPWPQAPLDEYGSINVGELLKNFNLWRQSKVKSKSLPENTATHLLSGYDFQGTTVGLASLSGACTDSLGSGVNQATSSVLNFVAKIVAHELGHNIGLRHTNQYISGSAVGSSSLAATCSATSTHVMQPSLLTDSGTFSWETCSSLWFKMFLEGYPYGCVGSACLYRKDYGTSQDSRLCMDTKAPEFNEAPVCGDGILAGNEECDCGSVSQCATVDPCCDATTCKRKPNAQCSPGDPCCDVSTCNFVPKSAKKVCRPARSSCDFAETCSGQSATCPTDDFQPAGTSCSTRLNFMSGEAPGKCFQGKCLSHTQQCNDVFNNLIFKDIGGECPGAGDANGNQGCAYLICKEAIGEFCNYFPIGASYLKTEDGTPCGTGKMCFKSKCVDYSTVEPESIIEDTSSPTTPLRPTEPPSKQPTSSSVSMLENITVGGYVPNGTPCINKVVIDGVQYQGCISTSALKPPISNNAKLRQPRSRKQRKQWCFTGSKSVLSSAEIGTDWGYCKQQVTLKIIK